MKLHCVWGGLSHLPADVQISSLKTTYKERDECFAAANAFPMIAPDGDGRLYKTDGNIETAQLHSEPSHHCHSQL